MPGDCGPALGSDSTRQRCGARSLAAALNKMRSCAILAVLAALAPPAGSLAPPPRRTGAPARSGAHGAPALRARPCRPLGRAGRTRLRVLGTDEEAIKEAKADKYKQALMEEWSSAWEEEGEKEGFDWEMEKLRSATQRGQ